MMYFDVEYLGSKKMCTELTTPHGLAIGEGLSVRLLTIEDMREVRDYYLRNREHLAPWEPLRMDDYFLEENFKSMLTCQIEDSLKGLSQRFGIFEKARVMGVISYTNIVKGAFMACNVGYSIDAELQGRGLMQKALWQTLGYMFEYVGMNRVMANYMPRNISSSRVLKKLGFGIEGYARSYLKIAGKWEDHILTSLIADEVYDEAKALSG